jgi:hypothetical protein
MLEPYRACADEQPEMRTATVTATSLFKPTKALALIIDANGTSQQLNTKFELSGDNTYIITFSFNPTEVAKNAYAVALLMDDQGNSSWGTLQALDEIHDLTTVLKTCERRPHTGQLIPSQAGLIKDLVNVREQRLANVRQLVADRLNEEYVKRLLRLETLFGLNSLGPISPDAPPLELIKRISRILNAVRHYKSARGVE